MTQTELFNFRPVGNLTKIEPKGYHESRLAFGQEKIPGIISGPPMPAPATSFDHVADVGKKILPPFACNSNTSREAAIGKHGHSHADRQRVYNAIRLAGSYGATREELVNSLRMSGDSIRPRCWELLGNNNFARRIQESGKKRLTASGKHAEVLVVI